MAIEKFNNSSKFVSLLIKYIENKGPPELFSFKLKPLHKGARSLEITVIKVLNKNEVELFFLIKDISQIKTLRSEINKAKESKNLRNLVLSEAPT